MEKKLPKPIGRDRYIKELSKAQRAAAAGRLILGELKDWQEFLAPETTDFSRYGRRDLRANKQRFRSGISKEIKDFCAQNFVGMTEDKLEKLYLTILKRRGLEMPLSRFETEFAAFKADAIHGVPLHATVVISLWGLQTKFPEDFLSKDILESIAQIRDTKDILRPFEQKAHAAVFLHREEIRKAVRTQEFAARTCLLACFNLLEATLNGLAWDFSQDVQRMTVLSNSKKKLVQDGTFREKLLKYPEIISGRPLSDETKKMAEDFISKIKTHRDALVHASPFSRPERYGGLDKLEQIYRIDAEKAQDAAFRTVLLLVEIFRHVRGEDAGLPKWLADLVTDTVPRD